MKVELVNVREIKPDPKNPRKGRFDAEQLKGMAETMETQSVINPIEIDEDNRIILGELRWRAARIAGLEKIPAIRKVGLSKTQKLERQLIENVHRQGVELGECIDELKELLASIVGLPTVELNSSNSSKGISALAKKLGVDRSYLSGILSLADAPKEIKEQIEKYYESDKAKGISPAQAVEVIKTKDPVIRKTLFKQAKEGVEHRRLRQNRSELETVRQLIQTKEGKKTPDDYISEVQKKATDLEVFLESKYFPKIVNALDDKQIAKLLKCLQTLEDLYIKPSIRELKSA